MVFIFNLWFLVFILYLLPLVPPPPRLSEESSLLDLTLFPTAKLHYSTPHTGPGYLTQEALARYTLSSSHQLQPV